jgi:hypothetical protein
MSCQEKKSPVKKTKDNGEETKKQAKKTKTSHVAKKINKKMILRVLKLRKKSRRRMGFTRNPALLLRNQVLRKASKRKQTLRRLLRWWSMLIQSKVILFILH